MTATLQQVCARAAELIRQRGWWAGYRQGKCGTRLCLGYAIAEAEEGLGVRGAYDRVRERLMSAGAQGLPSWNDAQPSAEPVLALLDQIAGEGQ